MNGNERWVVAATLGIVLVLVGIDLMNDSGEGVAAWHVLIEGTAGVAALAGIFYLLRTSYSLKRRLKAERQDFSAFKQQADRWRADSRKYLDGLSKAIDEQLTAWNLTMAEKQVAFLLLKGCGLKEVAAIRKTSEKTARAQSIAVYAKAGISGRSELAAFFLEDLLVPGVATTPQPKP